MITQEKISALANQHLANGPLFVTGIRIGADNQVIVFLDGDRGVTISDCVELSRHIEKSLGDSEDFSLDVSSHGAASPLTMPRQYIKHIGRDFDIKLLDGNKVEGTLVECDNEKIKLEYSVREDKPIGKGKITVVKHHVINYSEIKESKIKLKF
ncbi:MAG: ribosome assembly cofactor RimP [Bacteroidetes bacterium]|nr:ribosome assembly cofactor RimP [Bacteroidota bacterium]